MASDYPVRGKIHVEQRMCSYSTTGKRGRLNQNNRIAVYGCIGVDVCVGKKEKSVSSFRFGNSPTPILPLSLRNDLRNDYLLQRMRNVIPIKFFSTSTGISKIKTDSSNFNEHCSINHCSTSEIRDCENCLRWRGMSMTAIPINSKLIC